MKETKGLLNDRELAIVFSFDNKEPKFLIPDVKEDSIDNNVARLIVALADPLRSGIWEYLEKAVREI